MKKRNIVLLNAILLLTLIPSGCGASSSDTASEASEAWSASLLGSAAELNLKTDDDLHYSFDYGGLRFEAVFTPSSDNWKIIDSYKIQNHDDMLIICRTLSEAHPIHTADGSGFRTAEDMVYEWEQHNLAWALLPEDSGWKNNAKDVDINPEDQGKNIIDFYNDRKDDR